VTQVLGLGRLTRWSEGYVEKEWKVGPGFCTGDGTDQQALFGGYLAALADQVLTFAAMTVMDDKHAFKTSEVQVSFFRPITEGAVRIVGRVVNRSRTMFHVEAEFYRTTASLPQSLGCAADPAHDSGSGRNGQRTLEGLPDPVSELVGRAALQGREERDVNLGL
jgi:uncharacterized protein (TIGR00369 family)